MDKYSHQFIATRGFLNLCIAVLTVVSLALPSSLTFAQPSTHHATPSPKLQSYLQRIISDDPTEVVNVIVQKRDTDQQPEQVVSENGGSITQPLGMINAFAAAVSSGNFKGIAS